MKNQKRRMRRKNLKKMMMTMMMMNTQRQKQNVQKLPDLQLEQTNQQANLKKLSLDPHLVLLRKCRSDVHVSYHVCIYFVAEILQFRGL